MPKTEATAPARTAGCPTTGSRTRPPGTRRGLRGHVSQFGSRRRSRARVRSDVYISLATMSDAGRLWFAVSHRKVGVDLCVGQFDALPHFSNLTERWTLGECLTRYGLRVLSSEVLREREQSPVAALYSLLLLGNGERRVLSLSRSRSRFLSIERDRFLSIEREREREWGESRVSRRALATRERERERESPCCRQA